MMGLRQRLMTWGCDKRDLRWACVGCAVCRFALGVMDAGGALGALYAWDGRMGISRTAGMRGEVWRNGLPFLELSAGGPKRRRHMVVPSSRATPRSVSILVRGYGSMNVSLWLWFAANGGEIQAVQTIPLPWLCIEGAVWTH